MRLGLIPLLLLSLVPAHVEANQGSSNFELTILTDIGNSRRQSMAEFVRSALLPLNIEVNILLKDFSVIIGDLLHDSGHEPWDIAILSYAGSFEGGGLNGYDSNSFFGCFLHQLCNEDWQQWQHHDTGINQTAIDEWIQRLAVERVLSSPDIKQQFDEYQRVFMEELLYDFPMLLMPKFITTPSDLIGYDAFMGFLRSFKLGMQWESQDKDEFRYITPSCSQFGEACNLDPLQTSNSLQADVYNPLLSSLMSLDENSQPHPALARQWSQTDWVLPNGEVIADTNFTYWLYEDIHYMQHFANGSHLLSQTVQPQDLMFTLQISHLINGLPSPTFTIYPGENAFSVFVNASNFHFIHTDYTSGLWPTPTYLLNTTLTYNSTISGKPLELFELGLSPYDTEEWDDYEINPVMAGPFKIANYTLGEVYHYTVRDDYWFPNEWDSDDFTRHWDGIEDAFYFRYNVTNEEPTRKPTTYHIPNYTMKIRTDVSVPKYELLLKGEIDIASDIVTGEGGGLELLRSMQSNPAVTVHQATGSGSGNNLVFNLLNPHLQKYEIRRAIAHAIDKVALNAQFDNLMENRDSVMWNNRPQFYNDSFKIQYQYSEARDLMRKNNYTADETNEFRPDLNVQAIEVNPISAGETAPFVMNSVLVAIVVVIVLNRLYWMQPKK